MTQASILHLSDIHYKSPETNFANDNKADVPPEMQENVFSGLHQILDHAFAENHFAAVAVCGDITTHGHPEGFMQFKKETYGSLRRLVAESQAICMVPGNHDVIWDILADKVDYFDRKFKAFRLCVESTKATSCLIPTGRMMGGADNAKLDFLTHGHGAYHIRGPLCVNHDKRLVIACINSSLRCGEVNQKMRRRLREPVEEACQKLASLKLTLKEKKRCEKLLEAARLKLDELLPILDRYSVFDIPQITQAQMNCLGSCIRKTKAGLKNRWNSYIKVAMLHHHLVPFASQIPEYKAFEVAADAAGVLEMLAGHGFQVILTGHKHQRYQQKIMFEDCEVVIAGGLTVGGHPVTGHGQGVQCVDIDQDDDDLHVKITDLPCSLRGDIQQKVRARLKKPVEIILRRPRFVND
jgi:predicted phosphodiesterase